MSDQEIIDTIAASLNGHGLIRLGTDLRPIAEHVLTALRKKYAIWGLPSNSSQNVTITDCQVTEE